MLPRICMKKPHVLENEDTTAWFTELERYHMGEFSTAAYQANSVMEDYSQVEVGDNSLFVGIYDGHNGTNAPKFISNYIFQELSRLIRENNNMMNGQLLREAVAATEQKFTQVVIDNKITNPDIMHTGSCCLITLIWKGTLYVASLGDSLVLRGRILPETPPRVLQAVHLTLNHSCEDGYNRRTLEQQFPDDPTLLLKDENGWKVKGLSKVTGTIGDVYIKTSLTYSPKFKNLSQPISVLSSVPNIYSSILRYYDKFFIVASRGFWEIMTKHEAASIVEKYSRRGIAKTLLRKALEKAAARVKMSYKDILTSSDRKKYHDDMTIIVVFSDLDDYDKPLWKGNVPKLSYKSPSHT